MSEKSDMLYNVHIVLPTNRQVVIDWGNAPGWMEKHRDELESADMVVLVPKDGVTHMPIVFIGLGEGKRLILYRRTFGMTGSGNRMTAYLAGWQATVTGQDGVVKNEQSSTWVYENGAIEVSEVPTLWKGFLLSK